MLISHMCSGVKSLKTNNDLYTWHNTSIWCNTSALGNKKTVTCLLRQYVLQTQTNMKCKYWNVLSLGMLFGDKTQLYTNSMPFRRIIDSSAVTCLSRITHVHIQAFYSNFLEVKTNKRAVHIIITCKIYFVSVHSLALHAGNRMLIQLLTVPWKYPLQAWHLNFWTKYRYATN